MRASMRKVAKVLLLGLMVLCAGLTVGLATHTGQSSLLRLASALTSNTEGSVSIGDLDGSLFGDGSIDEISLSDKDGRWLTARGLSYSWSPWELLSGRLDVGYLRVKRIDVLRLPADHSGEDKPSQGSGFELPIKIALGELDLNEIALTDKVAGEAATLRVTGVADVVDSAHSSTARLQVVRLDGPRGDLRAHVAFIPTQRSLEIELDGSEPEGGIVSQLLDLPSRPAMGINIIGKGTLESWRADLKLSAGGAPFVAGGVNLNSIGHGTHRLTGTIAGYFEKLVPRSAANLFAGKTQVDVAADILDLAAGSPTSIRNINVGVSGDQMRIAATGAAELAESFIFGKVSGHIRRNDRQPLRFASTDSAAVSVGGVSFQVDLPEQRSARQLTASAEINAFSHEHISADKLTLTAQALQPQATGNNAGMFDGIKVAVTASGIDDASAVGSAVGQELRANGLGRYDGERLTVTKFEINGADASAVVKGSFKNGKVAATAQVRLANLARYSQISERHLKGQVAFDTELSGDLERHVFDVTISGNSAGVAVGSDAVDRLLAPETIYRAHIAHTADGALKVDDAAVSNSMLQASLTGSRAKDATNFHGNVSLAALAAVDPSLSGQAKLVFGLTGPDTDLTSKLTLSGDDITVNGKQVLKPLINFDGRGPVSRHAGKFAMTGTISGEPVKGAAAIIVSESGVGNIDDLQLEIAGAKLVGGVAFSSAALPSGKIKLDARDLGRVGRAIGVKLKGRITADLALGDQSDKGSAKLNLSAADLGIDDLGIKRVRATADVANYMTVPVGSLDADVSQIIKAGKPVGEAGFHARFDNGIATFKSNGRIDGGAFSLAGSALTHEGVHEIDLTTATYAGRKSAPAIRLATPSRISVHNGVVTTRALAVAIGSGTLRIDGSAGANAIDVRTEIKNVPAEVADLVAPDLGVAGRIDGTGTIKGSPSDPEINAKLTASNVSIHETRSQQLPAADISTDISVKDGTAQVNVRTTARGGLDLTLKGSAGLKKGGRLALSGQGNAPLGYVNVFLADRDARVEGVAKLAVQISGPTSEPIIDGTLKVSGATARDSEVGLELKNIDADIGFSRDVVTLRNLSAVSSKGGSLRADGKVQLPPVGDPSMSVEVKLAAFKFGNQDPVAGEIEGQLTIAGPVPALVARGDLQIKRMDITVPNQMPKSVQALDIKHVNAPKRFTSNEPTPDSDGNSDTAGRGLTLALDVRAYDRIFVRGRGLDAQLGGSVKIRGTANSPYTEGQFSMSRGRLTIIGRQLDFSRGNIIFSGTMEPTLDMEAKGDADGTTVIVTVTGPASKPKFHFSSSPELPEDEVVSLLLFNKKLAQLSPTQLVQLAGEIDKIGGLSSGPGTLDKMKSALGIDVLDVTTDEKGNAQATAGTYIDEKTYVGVKQGLSLGQSRIVIDHKLTKHLKARGEVGSDGESKLGVGFEWEY